MSNLIQRITEKTVPAGSIAAWWLGGSGFVFKTPAGVVVFLDAYLSNVCEAIWKLPRFAPTLIEPADVQADAWLSSHWHEDHLDPGSLPVVARVSPSTRFVMPPTGYARAGSWGVPVERITMMKWGDVLQIKDLKIRSVYARHDAGIPGHDSPDAMGFILESQGKKIYHTGDSEYDNKLRLLHHEKFDVATACINGVTGNMNAHEAAMLCWQLGARTVLPHHHELWGVRPHSEEATWDPEPFAETYKKLGGQGKLILPVRGQEMLF